MPYVKAEQRKELDELNITPRNAGELNYVMTMLILESHTLAELGGYLEERIDSIKIPEPVDVEEIKKDLETTFGKMLEHNINTLGMPDFRKLAMGLQAQIDSVLASAGDSSETGGSGLTQPQVMARALGV